MLETSSPDRDLSDSSLVVLHDRHARQARGVVQLLLTCRLADEAQQYWAGDVDTDHLSECHQRAVRGLQIKRKEQMGQMGKGDPVVYL
jgi:hypothetical protein